MHMARDMTKGNITGHLIAYAVPLVFGNLFQQLYHTVDSVVVGQFYGKEALAAVGAAGPIMNILTFLIVGLSLGASILMASYFGAKDYQHLKDEFATSVLSGLLLTIVLSGISLAGSRLFIRLTQTPEEISAQASLYLQIISLGLIFTFFYNIFSAALRAIGDSRAPLYVLILTTIVNVFLDVFLVGICRLGVPGAAIATIISQAVSALALFVYIWSKVPLLRLGIRDLKLKTSMLKKRSISAPFPPSSRRFSTSAACSSSPASMHSVSMQLPLLMPSPSSTATCSPRATASRHLSRRSPHRTSARKSMTGFRKGFGKCW